jgi:hypothetical protein
MKIPSGRPDASALPEPPVRDRDDPTEALVGVVPQPVRLDRRLRDRQRPAVAPAEGLSADQPTTEPTDLGRGQLQYRDQQGRPGSAQLGHAAVSEADLGLAFYPCGQLQPAESRRVQDPMAGESVSVTQFSADALPAVAAFYRDRFASLVGAALQEQGGADGEAWSLHATWPDGRVQAVTLLSDEGGTRVVLLRARPAAPGRR